MAASAVPIGGRRFLTRMRSIDFLIKPDQTIYYLSVQSMPFVRPNFSEMLQAVDYIIKNDYPARGEYTGSV